LTDFDLFNTDVIRHNDDDTSSIYSKFSRINISTFNNDKIKGKDEKIKQINDERRKLPSSIWTKEEDILLLKLSQSKLKNKWKKISKLINTKTASQCTYRLKLLSQSKIDPDSPGTSQQLSLKVTLNENNNKIHEKSNLPFLKTNHDKKIRNLGIKVNNVTKLFGVIKNDDNHIEKDKNVENKVRTSLEFKNPDSVKRCSDVEMRFSYDTNDNPFAQGLIRTSGSGDFQQLSNIIPSKDNEDIFKKEYNRTFNNDIFNINKKTEIFEKDINDVMLLDIGRNNNANIFKKSNNLNLKYTSNNNSNNFGNNQALDENKQQINQEEYLKMSSVMENKKNWKERLNEIKNYIASDIFKELTQINKMSQFSSFLVEININSKNMTSKEEEHLCMEIQSFILKCMIEHTQKQLITENGEELLV
jgi:hypothetical protein